MAKHNIFCWNVENLFDERDAPLERRPEKLKKKIAADLKVWTPQF